MTTPATASRPSGRRTGGFGSRSFTLVAIVNIFVLCGLIVVAPATSARAGEPAVSLGTAGGYSALGGSSVSNTGASNVSGDVGVSPGSSITGFPPGVLTGDLHRNDAAAQTARNDLQTAYSDAQGRTPTQTLSGDIGGLTLTPGVYSAPAALSLSTSLILDGNGDPGAVFIIQVSAAFSTAASSSVTVTNGAQASRVFWQISGAATLGAGSSFTGTILGLAAVTAGASATVHGRVLTINGALTMSTNAINPEGTVVLGNAFNYSLLAGTTVTNTGSSYFSANVGTSPGSQINGFPPGNTTGSFHPADADSAQAQTDLRTAYLDAGSRSPTGTLPAALDGLTLLPGTYSSSGSVSLSSGITLDGRNNPNSVFVLQVNGSLTTSSRSKITLVNMADPNRVFWRVSSSTVLGSFSTFGGSLLNSGAITIGSGTQTVGRALSISGSVTVDSATMSTLTPVALGTVANYSILGGTSVANVGPSQFNLNVGTSPSANITGFPPGTISGGALHAGDDDSAQARADSEAAYSDASNRTPTSTISGDISGTTFRSGVFGSAAALSLSGTATLDAQHDPNAVFVFQVNAAFSTAAHSVVQLINGAQPSRVFWQVTGAVTLGPGSQFGGTIITPAAMTLGDSMTLTGRAVSLNGAVSLSQNSVTTPVPPAGTLTAITSATTLSGVTLNGVTTQYASGTAVGWSISDARGSGAAWSLTISSTDFSSAAGTDDVTERTLPAGNVTVTPGGITAGNGADPSSGIVATPLALSASAQVLVASPGSNKGTYYFNPMFSLAVPPSAYRSNYSGQVDNSALNPYVATITVTIS